MTVSKKQEWDGELIPAFTTLGEECSVFSTSRDNKAIPEFTVKQTNKQKNHNKTKLQAIWNLFTVVTGTIKTSEITEFQ